MRIKARFTVKSKVEIIFAFFTSYRAFTRDASNYGGFILKCKREANKIETRNCSGINNISFIIKYV